MNRRGTSLQGCSAHVHALYGYQLVKIIKSDFHQGSILVEVGYMQQWLPNIVIDSSRR